MEKINTQSLEIVNDPKNEKKELYPEINGETFGELFRMDDLSLEENESNLDNLANSNPSAFYFVLQTLAAKGADYGLYIPEEYKDSFLYKRSEEEIKNIKPIVYKMIDSIHKSNQLKHDEIDFESVSRLFAIQRKKAEWAENNIYNNEFQEVADHAIGDVNRYLLEFYNSDDKNENFKAAQDGLNIMFKDELIYYYEGNVIENDTAGINRGNDVVIKMNTDMPQWEEWKIYKVLVHEIIHKVSYRDSSRLGLHLYDESSEGYNQVELNEAITEIVAAGIATKHYEDNESEIKGQSKVELNESGYFKYIVIAKTIFSKIPQKYFVDAMLTDDGFSNLQDKFKQEFGSVDELKRFANNLKDVYLPISQRK